MNGNGMRMQTILTSKNLAKLKQYYYLHAEFFEEIWYPLIPSWSTSERESALRNCGFKFPDSNMSRGVALHKQLIHALISLATTKPYLQRLGQIA